MIPFREIKDTKDRSWSLRLVDEIASERLDELDEILETLSELCDYRVEEPLTNLMLDSSRSNLVREAASDALSCTPTTESDEQRREWWHSDDLILKRHAVKNALRADADLIESIASNSEHQFHLEAIEVLGHCGIGWEEPRFKELKIKALSHKDADVRAAAAKAILWDEPVEAEDALISRIFDEDDSVVEAALHALAWYMSRKVLLALQEIHLNGPERLRKCCGVTLKYVLEDFQVAISLSDIKSEGAKAHLTKWLEPVQSLLVREDPDETDETASDNSAKALQPEAEKRSVEEIITELSTADGKWGEMEYRYWKSVELKDDSKEERNKLADFVCASPDHYVRAIACGFLAKWDMGDRLIELVNDRDLSVRKAATFRLVEVSPNKEFAARLWELLQQDRTQGCHASECLDSYLVHAPVSDEVVGRLTNLASTDASESVRVRAIRSLDQLDAKDAIASLVPILFEPPLVTWAVHIGLLEACVCPVSYTHLTLPTKRIV